MEDIDFLAVPREIKNIIASFLDDRAKRILRLANTEWFNIINYDNFTVYFARSSTLPDIVQTFSRYSKQIGLRFEKTISMDDTFMVLAILTNLTRLEIEPSKYAPQIKIDPAYLERATVLTALQRLNVAGNYMTKYIIDHFPNLTHLTIANTHQYINSNEDSPKFNIITQLSNLTRFRALDIIDKHQALAFSRRSVVQMSNVSKVSFDGRYVFFPFSQLPNLEYLDIRTNQFDDFSTSTKLTWLRIMDITGCLSSEDDYMSDLTAPHDFQQLSNLINLRYLDLAIETEGRQYSFLSGLTNLEVCKARSGLPDTHLKLINPGKLTHLEATLKSLESIAHLTNLRCLTFPGHLDPDNESEEISQKWTTVTRLTTRDIVNAAPFPNLKKLRVYRANLDTIPKHRVVANLSHLESLHVETIDYTALQVICGLTKLTKLTATYDQNSTYYFDTLTNLTALKELILDAKAFGAKLNHVDLIPALRSLTNLERLHLFDVGSNDDVIQTLESLPRLKHLLLKSDPEEFGEEKLSNLTNLQTLHWHNALLFFAPNVSYDSKYIN